MGRLSFLRTTSEKSDFDNARSNLTEMLDFTGLYKIGAR